MIEGSIEPDWITFDENGHEITFQAPAEFQGQAVQPATIQVVVLQMYDNTYYGMIFKDKQFEILMTAAEVEVEEESPCLELHFTAETLPDVDYIAGETLVVTQVADFVLNPVAVASECPEITHTYSYSMVSGSIEEDWITLDEASHTISFLAPANFDEEAVESAVIRVSVTQAVFSLEDDSIYASTTESFDIKM